MLGHATYPMKYFWESPPNLTTDFLKVHKLMNMLPHCVTPNLNHPSFLKPTRTFTRNISYLRIARSLQTLSHCDYVSISNRTSVSPLRRTITPLPQEEGDNFSIRNIGYRELITFLKRSLKWISCDCEHSGRAREYRLASLLQSVQKS